MGPGAEFPQGEGSHSRRTTARRTGASLRRPASTRWVAGARTANAAADDEAQAVVDAVLAFADEQVRAGETAQPRGMGRQMALAALLLEREDAGIERNLERAVQVYRRANATTPAALRKHASEARAILQYGLADGETLPALAAAAPGEGDEVIGEIDAVLAGLNSREILEARARRLSGQRGGRPTGEAFRVLSAVARLKENAGSGDPKAEAELRLVRTFLLDK